MRCDNTALNPFVFCASFGTSQPRSGKSSEGVMAARLTNRSKITEPTVASMQCVRNTVLVFVRSRDPIQLDAIPQPTDLAAFEVRWLDDRNCCRIAFGEIVRSNTAIGPHSDRVGANAREDEITHVRADGSP